VCSKFVAFIDVWRSDNLMSRFLVFRVSTPGSLGPGASLLINAQTNECRLDDRRGDSVFPPAFYKISNNSVHFDPGAFCEIAIHRGG
jgi:hypothetical protein